MRKHVFLVASVALTVFGGACATPSPAAQATPQAQSQTGEIRTFAFTNWAGPAIPVWSYRPAAAGPEAPILLVFHGVRRDADRYLREWIPVAEAWGVVVACPEFSADAFPGARAYNLGAVLDESGAPRPREMWTFSAIEPIFQALRARENMRTQRLQIYGHSAGAQFVHRLMMFAPPTSAERVIAANAGWYTMPNRTVAWPYGIGGAPLTDDAMKAFLTRDMTILLGTADNDPQHPSLNRDAEAMAQGAHRLARGERFFEEANMAARNMGAVFGWAKSYAPGIGHDNGKMADFAAPLLFGPSAGRAKP
jgi:poly(3-hydroxybutyrate) depolymerase